MNILKNAITSIKCGLDDFDSNEDERLISSVRNLHAGILLLYKEALLSLSPPKSNEVLIKQNIIPVKIDGKITFVGAGKNTVNTNQIKERFKSLNITTDWKLFDKINKLRNEIEHYYTKYSRSAISEAISDTFIIISKFIKDELKQEPKSMFGSDYWDIMLSVKKVFEEEREDCIARLKKLDWKSEILSNAIIELNCHYCGSPLLIPSSIEECIEDLVLRCRNCGESELSKDFVVRSLKNFFLFEEYLALTDGNDMPLVQCPFCFLDAYVFEEKKCLWCGESCEHTCHRCDCEIAPDELSDEYFCSYCSNKMDTD